MLVQGAFNMLFRPGLRKNFLDEYEQYEEEFSVYLKQSTMDTPEQSASIIAGLSRLYERGDGEPITYDTPKMGPKVMGVDKEFALGFMITRKTVEDDQYDKANQSAKWLGHAANMTKEYRSAAMLDDAFTGNTFKGIDSLSLCNTAHTLLNSSNTVANALATPVGVSVTGVTAMFDLAQQMKDENGDPIKVFPDTLLIGNSAGDLQRAMQIFGSDKEPFTAENQDNAIKKRLSAPKIQISRFKASTKPWFMIDSKWNDAHFVTRRPVEFDDDFDFNTDAALYKVTTRFLIWFVDWRGWLGSNAT
jgi:hypothetical protein